MKQNKEKLKARYNKDKKKLQKQTKVVNKICPMACL